VRHPGYLCGGILGNALPTNSTVGECPDLKGVGDALNNPTEPGFSWLCCSNNKCQAKVNVKVTSDSLALTNCETGQYSLMCFQDNGGWSCTGNHTIALEDISRPIGSCVLQVVLPNDENNYPTSTIYGGDYTSKNNPKTPTTTNIATSTSTSSSNSGGGFSFPAWLTGLISTLGGVCGLGTIYKCLRKL
jgi:hypothetical protein